MLEDSLQEWEVWKMLNTMLWRELLKNDILCDKIIELAEAYGLTEYSSLDEMIEEESKYLEQELEEEYGSLASSLIVEHLDDRIIQRLEMLFTELKARLDEEFEDIDIAELPIEDEANYWQEEEL